MTSMTVKPRLPLAPPLALAIALALVAAAPAPAFAERTRDYVVKAGDTCMAIATRELGGQVHLDAMHRLNPQLGPPPHNLVAGQVLKLPVIEVAPDAELAAPRGRVEVRRAGSAEWTTGAEGEDLFRTWRVGTRERSTATVKFADSSTIDMREDTVVVIFGPSAAQQPMLRTSVERGALRSRLAALDGKPRLSVDTPAGTAQLVEGSAVVDVDAAGETRLSNHTGKPATLANARGRVAVTANYGSSVKRDKPPTPPRPLPAAPAWVRNIVAPGELALIWRGDPPTLRGEWSPVAEAVKYRIEIARAETPATAEARLEVPAAVTKLEAANLPAAEYVVTVASVDAGGFEGRPSEPLRVQVIELDRPEAVTGATFTPPPGLVCRAGRDAPAAGDPPTPVVLVRDDGDRGHITCTSAAGTTTLELALPPPVLTAPPPVRPKRGEPTSVDIATSGVAPAAVQVTGRGVEVLAVEPAAGAVRVTLRAAAPGALSLALPGEAAPALVIPVDVAADAPPPPPPPSRSRRARGPAIALVGLAGATVGRLDDGALLGAEVEVALRAPLGAYLGLASRAGTGAAWGAAGLIARGTGTLRPLVRAGLAVDAERAAATLGVGLERSVARWAQVRAQGEAVISAGESAMHLVLGVALSR